MKVSKEYLNRFFGTNVLLLKDIEDYVKSNIYLHGDIKLNIIDNFHSPAPLSLFRLLSGRSRNRTPRQSLNMLINNHGIYVRTYRPDFEGVMVCYEDKLGKLIHMNKFRVPEVYDDFEIYLTYEHSIMRVKSSLFLKAIQLLQQGECGKVAGAYVVSNIKC